MYHMIDMNATSILKLYDLSDVASEIKQIALLTATKNKLNRFVKYLKNKYCYHQN